MQVELTIYDDCDCSDNAQVEIMPVDTIKDVRSLVAFCQHFDSRRYTIDSNEYVEPATTFEDVVKREG